MNLPSRQAALAGALAAKSSAATASNVLRMFLPGKSIAGRGDSSTIATGRLGDRRGGTILLFSLRCTNEDRPCAIFNDREAGAWQSIS